MATYAGVTALYPHIFEATLMYAQQSHFMPNLVTVYTDQSGFNGRSFAEYPSSGTVWNAIGETTDITAQNFNPAALGTVSIKEVAYRIDVTDRRAHTDANLGLEIADDMAREFSNKVFGQLETDLLAHFSAFTGGTVWSGDTVDTAGTLTWGNIYAARAVMEKAGVPGPYYAVVDPYHYHYLVTAANIAGLTNAAPMQLRDELQAHYMVTQIGNDMFMYSSPSLGTTAEAQVHMGLFTKPAIVLDSRKGFSIETERDVSMRATQLVANMYYGSGLIRPDHGVTIMGTVISSVNN